jgi:hypothetical protein
MGLNESDYELVSFIEQEYLLSGQIPSKDVCLEKLNLTTRKYDSLYSREDFRNAMSARGIPLRMLNGEQPNGVLTVKQLTVVNALLDLNDNRSDAKKLRDLNVNTSTYQGWQKDPTFNDYWNKRTEQLYGPAVSEANRALYDNVKRGDLGAIKLLFEMTGRWSSKPANEINIEWVLMKIMESIQKHVTDANILTAIAEELLGIQQEFVPVATGIGMPLQLTGTDGFQL